MQLSVFSADLTPPCGGPANGGLVKTVAGPVEAPLLGRGFVLRQANDVFAFAALDWCGISNQTWSMFRERLAAAVAARPEQVTVHAIHQHTAPIFDLDAWRRLERYGAGASHGDPAWVEQMADRLAAAANKSLRHSPIVTHVAESAAAVEQAASTRRVIAADGRIVVRGSSAHRVLQQLPEGFIDGYLRTLCLIGHDGPLLQLHVYGSHPQTKYDDGRLSCDVVGEARQRREQETGIPQIYCTGCGGDVTFGKYNSGTEAERQAITQRLLDAMRRGSEALNPTPVSDFAWQTRPLSLGDRGREEAFSQAGNERLLANASATPQARITAAMKLAYLDRIRQGPTFEVGCLRIGACRVVTLPGEPFVAYQLWAQQLRRDRAVFVIGYGDCAPWYLCTDSAFDEGGFEPTWAFAGQVEQPLKSVIAPLLE